MAASIVTSVITGGGNSHQTVSEELNTYATDFVTQGVVGAITSGPPATGSFGVTQDSSPDMGVTVLPGQAYVAGTPSGQDAQVLRARMTANYTSYTINSNSTGTTKYDWIYLQLNAANASNPDSAADNVINLYTSRSSSNSADNGSPPTYGLLLAIVTVANGASSIVNANISDQRVNTSIGGQGGSLIVTPQTVGQDAIIQAAGAATNINLDLNPKGSGVVEMNVNGVNQLGAWQSWTPAVTLAGGVTNGNAVITGRYIQIGKTVFFWVSYVLGSTTNFTNLTSITCTLPVPASATWLAGNPSGGFSGVATPSTSAFTIFSYSMTATTFNPTAMNVAGSYGEFYNFTPYIPAAWSAVSSNYWTMCGTYEAA